MRYPLFLTVQLASTFALLGAVLTGCVNGTIGSQGGGQSSSDGGNNDTTNPDDTGTGDTGPGDTGPGDTAPSGGNQGGGDPGTTAQGGSAGQGAGDPAGGAPGGGNEGAGSPGDNQGQGVFEAPNVWTKNIAGLPKNAESDAIIAWLDQAGGWGGGTMKIDFGLEVLHADSSTPKKQFYPTEDFYSPDCDEVPFPVPAEGSIEAEDGFECTQGGDCHLLVVHEDEKKLYEMWRADISGDTFNGGCVAVWDLTKTYPFNLRGEGCTSADAGGFPITAMLFTPDEVAAGEIKHALRFILPNARIRDNVYVHPGTHSRFPTSGGPDAPPYGVRFRLRSDFPMDSLPSDGARVIAKALQEYGMFLADGGTIALTGESDRFSPNKWEDMGVDSYSLSGIEVTDMEVVDMGDPISWSGDCFRNPPP